jgi:hypothetical protein
MMKEISVAGRRMGLRFFRLQLAANADRLHTLPST